MEHYFTKKPKSKIKPHCFRQTLLGNELVFHTGSGVFSIKKIDRGTQVLIENCIVEDGWDVLDMCCGYGPVGISLKAKHEIKLVMTDINKRALKFASENLKENNANAEIVSGSLYENVEGKFNTIIVNPPQTAGKDVCMEIIRQAPGYLKEGGSLQLVARHNKGGKSLSKEMEKVFGNVNDVAKKSGYRVYVSYLMSGK